MFNILAAIGAMILFGWILFCCYVAIKAIILTILAFVCWIKIIKEN